jgi:hypothetical protein
MVAMEHHTFEYTFSTANDHAGLLGYRAIHLNACAARRDAVKVRNGSSDVPGLRAPFNQDHIRAQHAGLWQTVIHALSR